MGNSTHIKFMVYIKTVLDKYHPDWRQRPLYKGVSPRLGVWPETIISWMEGKKPRRSSLACLIKNAAFPDDVTSRILEYYTEAFESDQSSDARLSSALQTEFPTPLFGRDEQINRIYDLLIETDCRLITLTGPGGIGKTRLAKELHHIFNPLYADGCPFFVLPVDSSDSTLLSTLGRAAGLSPDEGDLTLQKLLSTLYNKKLLIILDNFDAFVEEAPLIAEVLAKTPDTNFIITSQIVLNIREEQRLALTGLTYPNGIIHFDPQAYEAIQMFLYAAYHVNPDFDEKSEMPHIGHICQILDGNPLAIELAASWTQVISCQTILAELKNGLTLLSSGKRDYSADHKSIVAVLDKSWDMLNKQVQHTLMKLAVLPGTFNVHAVQVVGEGDLSILRTLVDRSLIQTQETERYRIHSLCRRYYLEKLAQIPGEYEATMALLQAYYTPLLYGYLHDLETDRQNKTLTVIEAELENIHILWKWAIENREVDTIREVALAMALFYDMRNWFTEAQAFFRNAYENLTRQHSSEENPEISRLVMRYLVKFSLLLSDYKSAEQLLNRKPDLITDKATEDRAITLRQLANIAYEKGDYPRALQRFEESLETMNAIGEIEQSAPILTRLGDVLSAMGQYECARDKLCQAHAIYEQFSDARGQAQCLVILGDVSRKLGDYPVAGGYFENADKVFQDIGDALWHGICLANLGSVTCQSGDYETALEVCQQAIEIFDKIDRPWQKQFAQNVLATIYAAAGDDGRAIALLEDMIVTSSYSYHRATGHISLARLYILNEDLTFARAALSHAIDDMPPDLPPLHMEWALAVFHLELATTGDTNCAWLHFIIEHPLAEAVLKSRAKEVMQLLPTRLGIDGADKAGSDKGVESLVEAAQRVLAALDSGATS